MPPRQWFKQPETKLRLKRGSPLTEPILCLDLPNQYLEQRAIKDPHASVAILDPVVMIERHGGNYHISARFNLETAIVGYHNQRK
jgi:hypothetical protein